MSKRDITKKEVLVGVLKNKRDLRILLRKHWYRIPCAYLPKRKFRYIAFYQPASFGKKGRKIEYYALISRKSKAKRIRLLPEEKNHPRAGEDYLKFKLKKIKKLEKPVKNIIPRRLSFGFTNLKRLLSAKNILELYGVPPTEQVIGSELKRLKIRFQKEYPVPAGGRRYRIDFAVFGKNRKIAVECDNEKAHGSKKQILKDRKKDAFLKRCGWDVVRLKEGNIMEHLEQCMEKIRRKYML